MIIKLGSVAQTVNIVLLYSNVKYVELFQVGRDIIQKYCRHIGNCLLARIGAYF